MLKPRSKSSAALIVVIIIQLKALEVTKCSRIEISKAENLEFNRQKVNRNFSGKIEIYEPEILNLILIKYFRLVISLKQSFKTIKILRKS